jgi:hypothetical protein
MFENRFSIKVVMKERNVTKYKEVHNELLRCLFFELAVHKHDYVTEGDLIGARGGIGEGGTYHNVYLKKARLGRPWCRWGVV